MRPDVIEKTRDFFKEHSEVIAVYLYGSFARGQEQRDSDMDLAVLITHDAVVRQNKLKREYGVGLARILRKDLHIVVMNSAGEGLMAQIFKYGQCIFNRKPELLSRFKMVSYAMIAEFGYYRNQMKKGLIHRILGEKH